MYIVNKQTEGIILSNHPPRQVTSDYWQSMTCRRVLNLKPSAEGFEQRMKVKMIMERVKKALEEQSNL